MLDQVLGQIDIRAENLRGFLADNGVAFPETSGDLEPVSHFFTDCIPPHPIDEVEEAYWAPFACDLGLSFGTVLEQELPHARFRWRVTDYATRHGTPRYALSLRSPIIHYSGVEPIHQLKLLSIHKAEKLTFARDILGSLFTYYERLAQED
ncbi:MAG: hypothetical protein AAFY77_04625 [Pseudomonadota bacterium]